MQFELAVVLATLLLSAFFSGSEIAFVSTNRLRIEIKGQKKGLIASLLARYIKKPSHFITSLLVGNNVAMVIYGVFFSALTVRLIDVYGLVSLNQPIILFLLQTVLASLVVLVVAEFVPKALCSLSPFKVLNFFALPLAIFFFPLKWLVGGIVWLSKSMLHIFLKVDIDEDQEGFSRVDLFHMVDENSAKKSMIESGEVNAEIFKNALEFAETKVRECMIPRLEVDGIEISSNVDDLKEAFFSTGRSKLLVFKEDIDNVLGYVHSIDLFNHPDKIQTIVMPMPFVSESTQASEVLRELIDKQRSMAQVIDEFGGTAGIVTIEDLIEEIFGEIEDEYDLVELREETLDNDTYIFSARQEIEYINNKYNLEIPKGDYDTLGGFVTVSCQRIPEDGEEIIIDNFEFKVLGVSGATIDDVKLKVNGKKD